MFGIISVLERRACPHGDRYFSGHVAGNLSPEWAR